MGIISYIKEEIQVIRERDPAIKSNMEVLLYPSFKVILRYRLASITFSPGGSLRERPERPGSRYIRAQRSGRGCSLTMGAESSSERRP